MKLKLKNIGKIIISFLAGEKRAKLSKKSIVEKTDYTAPNGIVWENTNEYIAYLKSLNSKQLAHELAMLETGIIMQISELLKNPTSPPALFNIIKSIEKRTITEYNKSEKK